MILLEATLRITRLSAIIGSCCGGLLITLTHHLLLRLSVTHLRLHSHLHVGLHHLRLLHAVAHLGLHTHLHLRLTIHRLLLHHHLGLHTHLHLRLHSVHGLLIATHHHWLLHRHLHHHGLHKLSRHHTRSSLHELLHLLSTHSISCTINILDRMLSLFSELKLSLKLLLLLHHLLSFSLKGASIHLL